MTAIDAPGAISLRSPVQHPLTWLLILSIAHVVVRVAISPALKWDEAEQILWSQQLQWGYGAQPPLYTWLQWGMNQLFGPSVLALSLLKHSLMALTYVLMWLAGRELLGPRGAWWAAASLMLLPPLGWSSIRDQTHTVLVSAMTCGTWWLLLRIVRRPRAADFAWLGLVCGLGMLSKYSFALVAAAMLLAGLSVPQVRAALLARGWWWAPVAGVLVVLPHGIWLLAHLGEATSGTLSKMEIDPGGHLSRGLLNLLEVVLGCLLPWALVALWAFRSAWWRRPLTPAAPWAPPVFWRYLLLVVLALLGMVLFGGVTNFKGRWVAPLLCAVPLAAFIARPELQRHPRAGRYTGVVVALALIMLVAAGVRPWFSAVRGSVDELNHPAPALADALRAAGYDGQGLIVASDHMLGGTLHTRFPQAPASACSTDYEEVVACVKRQIGRAQAEGRGWLLISRADRLEDGWWARALTAVPGGTPRSIQLPFRWMVSGAPPADYQFIWQPAPAKP